MARHASIARAAALALCICGLLVACVGPRDASSDAPAAPPRSGAATYADPSKNEVPLPAAAGWQASLVLDNGDVGVWTVGTLDAFPLFALDDIFGLDDEGHCWLLAGYSGKWTPNFTVEDGAWLGALGQADVDPRVDGPEIYTGGKKGNLYQIVPLREGGFDTQVIARFPSQEIHMIAAHDLMPERDGDELLVFTLRGEAYLVSPSGPRGFEARQVDNLEARVRQVLVLDGQAERPWMLAACRTGEVQLLRLGPDGLQRRHIAREPMGTGRVAVKPGSGVDGAPWVLYVTRDDGLLLRFEGRLDGDAWSREVIYAGPQGHRGVAAGHFDADYAVETVAVFGYSKKVQLLSRAPGAAWTARTIFVDRDKGHWLASAELDGRNSTTELIASGYGGRIVLLARDPGTGLDGVVTDPDPPERPAFVSPADGAR